MVIPGISGSFLLILLGNYKLLLVDSVNAFIQFLKNIIGFQNSNEIDFELIKILIIFCLGSVIGLILLSNLLSYLIKKYTNQINQLIIGFVSGSLLIIWPWKIIAENELIESWYLPTLNISTFISIFLMLIGFYIVLKLESFSKDN